MPVSIEELKGLLPPPDTAEGVLRLVLSSCARAETVEPNFSQCPNCDKPVASARTPYCSEFCKEMSAFVRQFRSALATGMIREQERQIAMGQKLWHLLGGGYPLRLTLIPEKTKAKLLHARPCAVCGVEAVGFDHLGSG
ncbi:MAG: hypothetical protein JSS72_12520 [Armatimonadetes bacterium]|nr:hypothetical protein [Armatimonadota bacterium]